MKSTGSSFRDAPGGGAVLPAAGFGLARGKSLKITASHHQLVHHNSGISPTGPGLYVDPAAGFLGAAGIPSLKPRILQVTVLLKRVAGKRPDDCIQPIPASDSEFRMPNLDSVNLCTNIPVS